MFESKKRKHSENESPEILSFEKLSQLSSSQLNQLKQQSILIKKELFLKYTHYQDQIEIIEKIQQKQCCHQWELHSDSGPYPCKWLQCSKCHQQK